MSSSNETQSCERIDSLGYVQSELTRRIERIRYYSERLETPELLNWLEDLAQSLSDYEEQDHHEDCFSEDSVNDMVRELEIEVHDLGNERRELRARIEELERKPRRGKKKPNLTPEQARSMFRAISGGAA